MLKIACISDTHCQHDKIVVPEADVIICAGDFDGAGTITESRDFLAWFAALPHRHRILVAGNHDRHFEELPEFVAELIPDGVIYLEDSEAIIDGYKFYGSPYQPWFMDWAFNLQRGEPLRQKWALIPDDTDVLITHGPPMDVLDLTPDHYNRMGQHVGCADLRTRVHQVKPKLHVFGHIHHSYGQMTTDGTTFVNASICDERYRPTNKPIVFTLD